MTPGFASAFNSKVIYVFSINDAAHAGCLKIGETSFSHQNFIELPDNHPTLNEAARKRINQYTQTAGIAYTLEYTAQAIVRQQERDPNHKGRVINKFSDFRDTDVHQVLMRSGIKRKDFDLKNKANEWFVCDLDTVIRAIGAVKEGSTALSSADSNTVSAPIQFRPEQQEAIELTCKQFKKGKTQMLWNAKMRFGKTLSALQVVKKLELRRTIIITHRPVVNESWFEDFHKIFGDSPQFAYSSKDRGESLGRLECNAHSQFGQKDHYVYFASLQDLRGSSKVGGDFVKNEDVFALPWDLVIIDEAHEGTQTQLGQSVLKELLHENTKVLYLSGTPFNLLSGFKQDEVYTWDYVMEQKAKRDWDAIHQGDPNPYSGLPQLNLYTYNLGKLFDKYAHSEFAFNFNEFFKVDSKTEQFAHDKDVKAFLDLLTKPSENNYPFSNQGFRDIFRHTLWVVPGVKAAKALSALLKQHPIFSNFEIVNVAGAGDYDENASSLGATEALDAVNKAIGPAPEESRTITISCGRLTTGVTVKVWTGVLMLAGSYQSTASSYLQTIFRVQSPATIAGKIKEQCYAFDFAPDRALKVIAQTFGVSKRPDASGKDSARAALGEFINFCPIISIDGSTMQEVKAGQVMEQIKRVYVEQVVSHGFDDVHLYNDKLLKLDDIDLAQFEQLKDIIGQTKALGSTDKIDLNQQGLTDEEHEQLEQIKKRPTRERTEEEKAKLKELQEKAKVRENAISILRGISIRMPLMIYGAPISNEDEELTIENFSELVDDVSWAEFMPQGVTKEIFALFIKYYDPDIFTASGKRIRALTRAADDMAIEERIKLISSIFANFRNPDKETVLTPWRVVNMHLSSTIGGYCFFDQNFTQELTEPRLVELSDITEQVFRPKTKLLEINSKSGLYPLYLAYTLVRLYLDTYGNKLDLLTRAQQRKIWDDVLKRNIFVICKSPMARSITERTLVGFREVPINTCYIDQLIERISTNPSAIKDLIAQNPNLWPNQSDAAMKFDAIVGNPPYQIMDGGSKSSAKPLYHHFVRSAKKLEPHYISFITPSRWFAAGKGLEDFREEMIHDHHMRVMVDFPNSKECFANADIAGGVNFFLWEREHEGSCSVTNVNNGNCETMARKLDEFAQYGLFVRSNTACSILHKATHNNPESLSLIVSTRNPFGIDSKQRGSATPDSGKLKLYASDGESYIAPTDDLLANAYTNSFKLLFSKVTSEHAGMPSKNGTYKVVARIKVLEPNEICTDSYLMIGCFKHRSEAEALHAYMRTTFVRYLLLQALTTMNITRERFILIPLQDFSANSDLDWTLPVAKLDQQLFAKYGLTPEECEEITSTISPM